MSFATVKIPANQPTLEQQQKIVPCVTDLDLSGEHAHSAKILLVNENTAAGRAPGLRRVERLMGTPVSLDIRDPFPTHTLTTLAEEVFGRLRQVDALFSIHRADSQVTLLDQGMLRPGQADPLVREVLNACARLNHRTNGYFDVHATGRLDLSGYLTGWALQHASALLMRAGATNHRLQAGGHLIVAGRPASDRVWPIRVHDPLQPGRPAWTLSATDLAVATVELGARDHIYNPITRRPATGLASVTIAGPDLGNAGAYATAAFAMGRAVLDWLPHLEDHLYTVIDDQGRRYEGPTGCRQTAADTAKSQ